MSDGVRCARAARLQMAPAAPRRQRSGLSPRQSEAAARAAGAASRSTSSRPRDGHFVCLHDDDWPAETTGARPGPGPATAPRSSGCASARNDGRPLTSRRCSSTRWWQRWPSAPADWPGRAPARPQGAGRAARRRAMTRAVRGAARAGRAPSDAGGTEWRAVTSARAAPRPACVAASIRSTSTRRRPPDCGRRASRRSATTRSRTRRARRSTICRSRSCCAGSMLGVDLVEMAKRNGRRGRRLDGSSPSTSPACARSCARLIEAGGDQITTDDARGAGAAVADRARHDRDRAIVPRLTAPRRPDERERRSGLGP